MYLKLYLLFIYLITALASAQDCVITKGAIPLKYCGFPASDLVYEDKILLPNQAHNLYLKLNLATRGTWSLADLEPQENDIWKNSIGGPIGSLQDQLPIQEQIDQVNFASYAITRAEYYGLTVEKNGNYYQLFMGTKIHNFLIRRNLLRKIGYTTPGIKYLKNVRVNFQTTTERDDFLTDFQASVGRDTSRWITSSPIGEKYFYAQDLIATEDQVAIPNLAVGFIPEDIMDNKRIFKSLLIPFSLTDVPESINMFSWAQGRIFSNNVIMPYEYLEDFTCSHDDAIWITKRILSLSEKDWEEIAFSSNLPEPVAMLLFEKLKSRRNHLSTLFNIASRKLPVNDQISDEIGDLKNGSLEKEFFNGYGRRFKIPDPDSPLAYSEMVSVIKARGISEGLGVLTNTINNYLSNNINDQISSINTEINDQATKLLKEGKNINGLVKSYLLPTVSGSLIVSRNIVAGNYLGTNNLIQLVDTLGVSVSAGVYGGLAGVYAQTGPYVPSLDGPAYFPVSLSANANLTFNRSYAHVKPITSLKKALKYPFKNVVIPLLKRKIAKDFTSIGNLDFEKINNLAKEERNKEIQEIYRILDENLVIGESLIVTDYAGLGLGAQAGMNLYSVVDLQAKADLNTIIMSRLHILRKSQDIFQIYKDFGNNNSFEVALGISKFVPIAKIRYKKSKGTAETKFFSLKLNTQEQNFKQSILAIAQTIKHGSLSALKAIKKPFIIKHKFNETNPQFGLIFYTWNKLNSSDRISVQNPQGDKKEFYRRYTGTTSGIEFESYAHDLISLFQNKLISTNFSPLNFSNTNIGYSFYGRAVNKIQTFEAEINQEGQLERPSLSLSRVWNGWRISKKRALKILDKIKQRYNFNFVSEHALAQTQKLFLYNFTVSLYVHKEGISAFNQLSKDHIQEIFKKHQSRDMTNYPGDDALIRSQFKRLIRYKQRYTKYLSKNDHKKSSRYLLNCIKIIEQKLTTSGYSKIFGSSENFLLTGNIDGFRIGDERGDEPIITNTLGSIGNDKLQGATSDIFDFFRQDTGDTITEGEFFINWILGRII